MAYNSTYLQEGETYVLCQRKSYARITHCVYMLFPITLDPYFSACYAASEHLCKYQMLEETHERTTATRFRNKRGHKKGR